MIQIRLIILCFCIIVAGYLLIKPSFITKNIERTDTEDDILKTTMDAIINEIKSEKS